MSMQPLSQDFSCCPSDAPPWNTLPARSESSAARWRSGHRGRAAGLAGSLRRAGALSALRGPELPVAPALAQPPGVVRHPLQLSLTLRSSRRPLRPLALRPGPWTGPGPGPGPRLLATPGAPPPGKTRRERTREEGGEGSSGSQLFSSRVPDFHTVTQSQGHLEAVPHISNRASPCFGLSFNFLP